MSNLEHNVKRWEQKKKKAQLQTMVAGIVFLGLLSGIIGNMTAMFTFSSTFPLLKISLLAVGVLIFLFVSLSSWTNYSFLYHYFSSQWVHKSRPDDLKLLTGTLEYMDHVHMPYAGVFKRIQLRLKNEEVVTLYVKPTIIKGIKPSETVRVKSYHLFVVDVYR